MAKIVEPPKHKFRKGDVVRYCKVGRYSLNVKFGDLATVRSDRQEWDTHHGTRWVDVDWNRSNQTPGMYDAECFELYTPTPEGTLATPAKSTRKMGVHLTVMMSPDGFTFKWSSKPSRG